MGKWCVRQHYHQPERLRSEWRCRYGGATRFLLPSIWIDQASDLKRQSRICDECTNAKARLWQRGLHWLEALRFGRLIGREQPTGRKEKPRKSPINTLDL